MSWGGGQESPRETLGLVRSRSLPQHSVWLHAVMLCVGSSQLGAHLSPSAAPGLWYQHFFLVAESCPLSGQATFCPSSASGLLEESRCFAVGGFHWVAFPPVSLRRGGLRTSGLVWTGPRLSLWSGRPLPADKQQPLAGQPSARQPFRQFYN